MLDGLQYVIAQVAIIVVVAAILAGILGWLIGRASGRRSAAKALASTPVSRLQPAPAASVPPLTPGPVDAPPAQATAPAADTPAYVPAARLAEPLAPTAPPAEAAAFATLPSSAVLEPTTTTPTRAVSPFAPEPVVQPVTPTAEAAPSVAAKAIVESARTSVEPAPLVPEPVVGRTAAAPTHGYGEPTRSYGEPTDSYAAPTHGYAESADDEDDDDEDDVDPDRTVLRPAPSWTAPSKTPQYAPPRFIVVSSTLPESALVQRTASVQEVQELRRELRIKELELGKLEAGALSAWDRTVPRLEAEILELQDENAVLRRTIRDAQEHSDADAQTVERLRASIAERDARLADLRAQG